MTDEEKRSWTLSYLDDLYIGDGVVAIQDGQVVGVLVWQPREFEERWPIVLVWTHPEYQRRGIATDLAVSAAATRPLRHSAHRTSSAEAWSRTTGLPRPEQAVPAPKLGDSGEWAARLAAQRLSLDTIDVVRKGPADAADIWPNTAVAPPYTLRPRRVVDRDGLKMGQEFWLFTRGQQERDGMARALSGIGTLWAQRDGEDVGLLQFQLLRAPWADGDGEALAIRVFAVKVERPLAGIASAMYAELRDAHPGYLIGADEELTDTGRQLVKHLRQHHPKVHLGRFDTSRRLHATSGPEDPLYDPKVLD